MTTPLRLRTLLAVCVLCAAPAQAWNKQALAPAIAPAAPGATDACAYVGAGTAPTPEGMDIFPARIWQINGERPRLVRDAYRLQPGKHVLVLEEGIPRYRLGNAQRVQIAKMQRRKDFSGYFKPLVIEVRPDTLQRVGVRLVRERLDTASIRENAYWEPIVWEEVPRPCR